MQSVFIKGRSQQGNSYNVIRYLLLYKEEIWKILGLLWIIVGYLHPASKHPHRHSVSLSHSLTLPLPSVGRE